VTIAQLIEQHQMLKGAYEKDQKRFNEHWKATLEQMQQLQAKITEQMTQQGIKSQRTDHGTAILADVMQCRIDPENKEQYLDNCLENWDAFGGEMLQIGAPKVEAVRAYMDQHGGQLPPFVKSDTVLRFSIRKA
jgi:hypothetical protein